MGDIIKKQYIENYQIWPERTPGANTIAYFPLDTDQLDHSGNGVTLSTSGIQQTIGYSFDTVCYFTDGNVNFRGGWYEINSVGSVGNLSILEWAKNAVSYHGHHQDPTFNHKIALFTTLAPDYNHVLENGMSLTGWHYLAFSYYDNKIYLCRDGDSSLLYNGAGAFNGNNVYLQTIDHAGSGNVTYSNMIAEKIGWSPEEMTDYYNSTKAKYES